MTQAEEHLSISRYLRVFKVKHDVEREAGDWVLILDTEETGSVNLVMDIL
jgi:hypothetical protein